MILVSSFDVSGQKSIISNFVSTEHPQIGINFTYLGMKANEKVSSMEIVDFWLETSKSGNNIN